LSKEVNPDNYTGWDDMIETLTENDQDIIYWLPIYLYDHSGLSISHSSFGCRWDSGQIGFHILRESRIKEVYGTEKVKEEDIERAKKELIIEMETYNDYLNGNCFSFTLYEDEEYIDSCSGFIGIDLSKNGILDNIPTEITKALNIKDNEMI